MRSEWAPKGEIEHILAALMPQNRLACEVSLITGFRINDVLALKPEQVKKQRFTIKEEKTGKSRTVRLPKEIVDRCLSCAGQHYVFEGRLNGREHRTRQAVFKDLRRVAKAFRVKEHLTPHSLRKVYAVEEYAKHGDLKKVQKLLNHSSEAVTMLYAMANVIGKRSRFEITKSRKKR
jgi:integrase